MIKSTIWIFLMLITCSFVIIQPEDSYGHGLGMDTIKTTIGGKQITITTQITPSNFAEVDQRKIIVSAIDSVTNQGFADIIFHVDLFHEGKKIVSDSFFTDDGMLAIHVRPTTGNQIQINGERDTIFNAWHETNVTPIELVGPIFDTGGLYHFEIDLKVADEAGTIEDIGSYTADVIIVTDHPYPQVDKNGNEVGFGVRSYYDKVSNFEYDSGTNTVNFVMPFDWEVQNVSHVPVVHMEVHFPKNFGDFFVPSYVGRVNGIELFKSSLTIDDYSATDERIVHFVLSQDNLGFLKQTQKAAGIENPQNMQFSLEASNRVIFPLIAVAKNERVQVDLSWDPVTIEPNKNTRFIFTFRNPNTGETLRNTSYDFVIMQNGIELYKKSANAQIGGDFADYMFLDENTGPTIIRFENIRGTDAATEFGITVVPEFGSLALVILCISISTCLVVSRLFNI
jgi:predicted secreted protein with PEFG-CTERM motif